MDKQQVIALMKSSRTPDEWNKNCDIVKANHGGDYPDYWYSEIVCELGVLFETRCKWLW